MTIKTIMENQRCYYQEGHTRSVNKRKNNLKKLYTSINLHQNEILVALHNDLGKCKEEAYLTEISTTKHEIKQAIKRIDTWAKPKKVCSSLSAFPSKGVIYHEPLGNVLILSPWNYPFFLAFAPLVSAIASEIGRAHV